MGHPNLLPCPFCGSPAVYAEKNGDIGYTHPSVRVQCSRCFAKTPSSDTEAWRSHLGHYTVEAQAFGEVAEMWNTRSKPAAQEGKEAADG